MTNFRKINIMESSPIEIPYIDQACKELNMPVCPTRSFPKLRKIDKEAFCCGMFDPKFNTIFIYENLSEKERKITAIHELAHALVYANGSTYGYHGPEFQKALSQVVKTQPDMKYDPFWGMTYVRPTN